MRKLAASALLLVLAGTAFAQVPAAAPSAAAPPPAATAEALAFYTLAAVAALAALGCVLATNIVRMAMCLLAALAAVALLYFLLAATFLGVIQLIVYAGGTLIVIVFGVMLTSRTYGERLRARPAEVAAGVVVGLVLLTGLIGAVLRTDWAAQSAVASPARFTVAEMGTALLTTYLVPFELASVLLLAVMIGAAYLAAPLRMRNDE
jgi:NADH-quinone oxidoreductase subunit J